MVPRDDVDPPNALPRGTRLGEFEVRRVLGIGGFGIVYLAFDHALERELAVKEYMPASLAGRTATLQVSVLSQAHAETFALGLRSFVNEARLLARFDHPSLVKVYRYWEQNDTAYMAMPFYDGDNLQRVRQRMVQPPDEAWIRQLLTPLLGALERLHGEAVFHRDISPDNVIVQPDGRPVLLDFGAARRVISDKSMALTAILKPAYAPIEQYAEVGTVKQGPWTDLYALGATVHYLLTGHPPTPATARAVQDDSQPLALQALPGCSPEFLHCVDWMLRPRPAERPQSVAELCAALDGRAQVPAAISGNWARTQWLAPADQVTVVAPPAGVGKPHGPAAAATPGTAPGPTGGAADESTRTDTTAASAAKHAADHVADHAATLEPGLDSVVPSADRPMAAGGAAHLQAQTAGTPARRWPAVAVLGLAGLVAAWFGLRPDSGSSAEAERRASGGALPAASAAGPAAVLASGAAPGLATAGPVAGTTPGAASAALPAALSAPATAPAPSAAVATAPAAMPTQGPSTPVATLPPAPATANAKTLIPASAPVVAAPLRQANVAASKPGALFGSQKPTPTPPAVVTSVPSAPPKLPPPLPAATPSVSPPTNALTSAATALHSPAATAPSTTVPAPVLPTAATAMAEPVKPVPSATPAPPTPAAAPAAPAPVATPATVTTTAAALPSATASHTATAAPAPRPVAQRDAEPRVRSRVLGPSERCEGRSLVTFQACVDNQCKQPELREHPECQKLRREQEQQRGGSVRY